MLDRKIQMAAKEKCINEFVSLMQYDKPEFLMRENSHFTGTRGKKTDLVIVRVRNMAREGGGTNDDCNLYSSKEDQDRIEKRGGFRSADNVYWLLIDVNTEEENMLAYYGEVAKLENNSIPTRKCRAGHYGKSLFDEAEPI